MTKIRRRDLVRLVAAGSVAGIGSACAPSDNKTAAPSKRGPQYQAHSPEVQAFYRVNRYPAK